MDKKLSSNEFQIDVLKKELDKVNRELATCKKLLSKYEIDELEDEMSDAEYICVEEIKKLKRLSETQGLSEVEVKMFDILNKNLRIIQGNVQEKLPTKQKEVDIKELLKIVKS